MACGAGLTLAARAAHRISTRSRRCSIGVCSLSSGRIGGTAPLLGLEAAGQPQRLASADHLPVIAARLCGPSAALEGRVCGPRAAWRSFRYRADVSNKSPRAVAPPYPADRGRDHLWTLAIPVFTAWLAVASMPRRRRVRRPGACWPKQLAGRAEAPAGWFGGERPGWVSNFHGNKVWLVPALKVIFKIGVPLNPEQSLPLRWGSGSGAARHWRVLAQRVRGDAKL